MRVSWLFLKEDTPNYILTKFDAFQEKCTIMPFLCTKGSDYKNEQAEYPNHAEMKAMKNLNKFVVNKITHE